MLISSSMTCAACCWRRLDKQPTKEAWSLNVPLMLIVLPGPKNVPPIHYRIVWPKMAAIGKCD